MSRKRKQNFDSLVQRVLLELPVEVCSRLEEVPIVVSGQPTAKMLEDCGRAGVQTAYGLVYGLAIHRPAIGVPMHIRLFRKPILRHPKRDKLKVIQDILLHELGHLYGLTCSELLAYGV